MVVEEGTGRRVIGVDTHKDLHVAAIAMNRIAFLEPDVRRTSTIVADAAGTTISMPERGARSLRRQAHRHAEQP